MMFGRYAFAMSKSYTINLQSYFYSDQGHGDALNRDYSAKFALIEFEQLERLEFVLGDQRYKNGSLELIGHYKEVKCLDYSSNWLYYEDMWSLVDLLPNLNEIAIRIYDRLDPDKLLQLMKDSNLKIIRVGAGPMVEEYRTITLPRDWTSNMGDVRQLFTDIIVFSRNKLS